MPFLFHTSMLYGDMFKYRSSFALLISLGLQVVFKNVLKSFLYLKEGKIICKQHFRKTFCNPKNIFVLIFQINSPQHKRFELFVVFGKRNKSIQAWQLIGKASMEQNLLELGVLVPKEKEEKKQS